MIEKYRQRADLARGVEPVELLLKNCKIVNVFQHTIMESSIAIHGGKIIGFGEYDAQKVVDMGGKFVAPGLVDSHIHLESAMVTPTELARVIVPRGTTTVIADPHEISNVCGHQGLQFMLQETKELPFNVFIMLPSCVPATEFEDAGAVLTAKDLAQWMDHPRVLGLGELMDYPGTIEGNEKILEKMRLADHKIIDGHSPLITGKNLYAYMINGVKTDHECTNPQEMKEKLGLGMYIAIREGSAARDLEKLIPHVDQWTQRRVTLCTDDKHPGDLLGEGHIDHSIRKAITLGVDPISAIQMATLNPAECYGLRDIGAIAPGYDADLIVLDNLVQFEILEVYKKGQLVAKNKELLIPMEPTDISLVNDTMHLGKVTKEDLKISLKSDLAKVIRVTPGSLLTEAVVRKISINQNQEFVSNPYIDVIKLAVIERHHGLGKIGLGLIENLKIQGGAIGTTVAHDSHNLIVAGDNDEDMLLVIEEIKKMKGGIAIAKEGQLLYSLALPVAGLMSTKTMEEVHQGVERILQLLYQELGANEDMDPLMTLSFMSLPVIPDLKLTDRGLFDVTKMEFTQLDIEK